MTQTLTTPTYEELREIEGQHVTVDGYDGGELTVECVSTPIVLEGYTSFDVILTGPADREVPPGRQIVRASGRDFLLRLVCVARDLRDRHYEAHVVQV